MIEIKHLKKEYEKSTPLIDVSTVINEGDAIAVIGPSGTGKSTLLRCINLLEKPTSGQIIINGEDITAPGCDINRVRTKLGMVFQSFNLYEHLTAVENCMIAQTVLLKKSKHEAYEKAMELLKSVGMEEQALKYPFELSGGQKQRTAIARTLSTDPDIILFDEPTSALDPLTVSEVENVIDDLSKQGRTMMIVTHSMEFAQSVSNRVFYMDQGGIYEEGTPQQIFGNPKKDLTQKFIIKESSIDLMVTNENHNLAAEIEKIQTFCMSRHIDVKRTLGVCAVYEEYLNMLYNYVVQHDMTAHMTVRYESSKDRLSLSAVPYERREWLDVEKTILNSIEFQLLFHYVEEYKTSAVDEGCGTKYTYLIKGRDN